MLLSLITIALSTLHSLSSTSADNPAKDCPPNKLLSPCNCVSLADAGRKLVCDQPNLTNLKSTFAGITQRTQPNQRFFDYLIVYQTSVKEIPEAVAGGLLFDKIYIIDNDKLTRIHSRAFAGAESTVKRLVLTAKNLNNDAAPYNLFDFLNTLTEAEHFNLVLPKFSFLPSSKLRLPKLKLFHIHTKFDSKPMKISDKAFYEATSLVTLDLPNCRINHVGANAFSFKTEVQGSVLTLGLYNNNLNGSSFEDAAFSDLKRPAEIYLHENRIKFLKEAVFKPFFEADYRNNIADLKGNPLDCSDCRNYWLKEYSNRVPAIFCDDDDRRPFFDADWSHCESEASTARTLRLPPASEGCASNSQDPAAECEDRVLTQGGAPRVHRGRPEQQFNRDLETAFRGVYDYS